MIHSGKSKNNDMKTAHVLSHFKVKGNWSDSAKKLKAKFPILTDTDLQYTEGNDEELLKRIEVRLDKRREEVVSIVNHLEHL